MTRIFWTSAVLLIVHNGALASSDPRIAKTCGLEVVKCFSKRGQAVDFKEQIRCFESLMKLPDCERVQKELTSLTKVFTSYDASGITWPGIIQKFECLNKEEKLKEFLMLFKAMVGRHIMDPDEADVKKIELIANILCCAMPEYVKVLKTIEENECTRGAKEVYETLLKPAMQFADTTLCNSAEKERCNIFFPTTKIEASA